LDESKVTGEICGFHGLEIEVRRLAGASAVRIVHPETQGIEAHRHDLPFLMLPVLGGCKEISEAGEARVVGAAAVLHPPGAMHADRIGEAGLETFTIEFDPAWLRRFGFAERLERSRYWLGGPVATAAAGLKAVWSDGGADERALGAALAAFLTQAGADEGGLEGPGWLDAVGEMLAAEAPPPTLTIARRLDLHPAWLARVYRAVRGEGLGETLRRKRIEAASGLLRRTALSLAEIAQAAGFCDQSHMNRDFRRVLGRTPVMVRAEQAKLSAFAA
jgi:AraC family transcriptional regulator